MSKRSEGLAGCWTLGDCWRLAALIALMACVGPAVLVERAIAADATPAAAKADVGKPAAGPASGPASRPASGPGARPVTAAVARATPQLQSLVGAPAAAKMRALMGGKPTIQARFAQTVLDANGAVIQRSLGTFTAQQPRQLHWQVQSPAAQLLITDGSNIWLYDPDLQQVTVDKLDAITAEAPMLVLSGQVESLLSKFDLAGEGRGKDWTFRLQVRRGSANRGSGFQAVSVRVVGGDIASMRVDDALAQRTELVFTDVQHPPRVDAKLFRFVIPPGTEVVRR